MLTQTGDSMRIPRDLEAEKEALGILLVHPKTVAEPYAGSLEAEHFYEPHHQVILRAVRELGPDRKAADFVTVADQIRANGGMGWLTAHGEDQYLITLANESQGIDELEFLCRKLRKLAAQRAAIHQTAPTPYFNAAAEVADAWSEPPPVLIPTGIEPIDRALNGGLMPESVTVLCAGTGRGKTGLAVQFGSHWLAQGEPVLFIQTELSRPQVYARFLAPIIRRPWLEVWRMGQQAAPRLAELAQEHLQRLKIHIWTRDDDIGDIVDRFAQATGRAPRVILDQLGDPARARGVESMRNAAAAISGDLKELARTYKGLIFAVCPVSRNITGEQYRGKRGADYESAAKDAGEVEYDAAQVLYLDFIRGKQKEPAAAELHVAKSRSSQRGEVIPLRFHAALGIFEPGEGLASGTDETTVLDAIKVQATQGKPASVASLKSATKMGQGRILSALATLTTTGKIKRDPRAGIHLQQPGEAS